MRITTWNINGLRTLRQYRPWYNLKDWKECLDYLEADIICFQEVKLTRKVLVANHRDMCVPDGYEAYYDLHPKKGYSGVATFVKKDACLVQKAERGLTGELVVNKHDGRESIGGYPDERAPESPVYDQIDAEGRGVIVDCGLFVLFNLYCPNETDEGRREYKMAYYHTLAERVQNLLKAGREVIIVGDLNIAHLPIDHCEGVNQRTRQEHLDIHPARHWLDQFLTPNGEFHDVTRKFHPTRKFMYTCWDTVKDTRPANYGVRIDYTLVSRGLLPWIKYADIQPNIYGSDHCPVYVDIYDEIQTESGETIKLKEQLMGLNSGSQQRRKAPSLATSNWPEFVGRRIQSFFAPKAAGTAASQKQSNPDPKPVTKLNLTPSSLQKESQDPTPSEKQFTPSPSPVSQSPRKETPAIEQSSSDTSNSKKQSKRATQQIKSPGQSNLRSFFQAHPKAAAAKIVVGESQSQLSEPNEHPSTNPLASSSTEEVKQTNDIDSMILQDEQREQSQREERSSADRVASAMQWGSIFAPKAPPLCSLHREPARAWTVNKPGPNHGRKFWMCARPVGSSGTGDAADDHQFRCSFWKWDSDIRNRQSQQKDGDVDGSRSLPTFHEVAGRAPRLGSGEKRELDDDKGGRAPHKSVVKRQKSQQSP